MSLIRGRGRAVAAASSAIDDPFNQLRRDVFIGAKVKQFTLAEAVDDLFRGIGIRRDQVKQAVHETLDAAFKLSLWRQQDRGLGAAFGNVLVLELLSECEAIGFIVETFSFARILIGARRCGWRARRLERYRGSERGTR